MTPPMSHLYGQYRVHNQCCSPISGASFLAHLRNYYCYCFISSLPTPFQSTKAKSNLTVESTNKMNAAPNVDISTSPSTSFQTAPSSHGASALTARTIIPLANAKHLKPFATEDIKVLLLENVNQTGRDILTQQGYQVEALKSSLPEDQLIEKIR